jgi:hypothetical protein
MFTEIPDLSHCIMSVPPSAASTQGASGCRGAIVDAELTYITDSCRTFLLPNDTVLAAIQDVGKVSIKSDPREIVYPLVKKLAGKFHDNFHEKGFLNLPANKSQTTDIITLMIINMHKHLDKASIREDFCSIKTVADSQKSTSCATMTQLDR